MLPLKCLHRDLFVVIIVFVFYCFANENYTMPSEEDIDELSESFAADLMRNGNKTQVPAKLETILEQLCKDQRLLTTISNPTFCFLCNFLVQSVIKYRDIGGDLSDLKLGIKPICQIFQTERVCDGLINLNADIFIYILKNKRDLNAKKVCGILGQELHCAVQEKEKWSISLPPEQNRKIVHLSNRGRPLRILHITDIHYDHKYKAGYNADCPEPLCCGYDQGKPLSKNDAAGAWGEYGKCDMPLHSVKNLFEQVSKHDIDIVYHTGDIINHRVWETSRDTNIHSIKEVHRLIRNAFPNTPVYSIIGNHEPSPLNIFAPKNISQEEISSRWFYDLMAEEWKTWLPKSALETVRKSGDYTVLVRTGFRIIGLNSNLAYIYNWWLLYSTHQIQKQLTWLVKILQEAEENNEIVHILSHIPSGEGEMYKKWGQEYNKIVERFSHIIAAQFVGHTHYDEFNLYYDKKGNPMNVAWNGGSFTTYIDVNPMYRIYKVDPNNYKVEDFDTWMYNVTDANRYDENTSPIWNKLYSFKNEYNLKTMEYDDLHDFIHNMAIDSRLLNKYHRLKVRNADTALKAGCDNRCKETNLCKLVTTEYGNNGMCNKLLSIYRQKNK